MTKVFPITYLCVYMLSSLVQQSIILTKHMYLCLVGAGKALSPWTLVVYLLCFAISYSRMNILCKSSGIEGLFLLNVITIVEIMHLVKCYANRSFRGLSEKFQNVASEVLEFSRKVFAYENEYYWLDLMGFKKKKRGWSSENFMICWKSFRMLQ